MPHQYPVFEAAITGRIPLEGSWKSTQEESAFRRAPSNIDMDPQTEEEKEVIRNAVRHEGVLLSLLDVLRRVPRRVLMVLKLNDLTRYEWYMCFLCCFLILTTGAWIVLWWRPIPTYVTSIFTNIYLTNTERSESSSLLLNTVHMLPGKEKDNGWSMKCESMDSWSQCSSYSAIFLAGGGSCFTSAISFTNVAIKEISKILRAAFCYWSSHGLHNICE